MKTKGNFKFKDATMSVKAIQIDGSTEQMEFLVNEVVDGDGEQTLKIIDGILYTKYNTFPRAILKGYYIVYYNKEYFSFSDDKSSVTINILPDNKIKSRSKK